MSSSPGILITHWTIRLALACYVVFLAGELFATRPRWRSLACFVWTLGCVLFDVHVACAFHFFHHWSHAAAWQHTAERTHALLGFAFGDGIFFSYAFLAFWLLDVVWLWLATTPPAGRPGKPRRAGDWESPDQQLATAVPRAWNDRTRWPRWRQALHLFLFFIALNGAVIFESGPTRWAGLAICSGLGFLVLSKLANRWPGGSNAFSK